jgi:hypothetical protein
MALPLFELAHMLVRFNHVASFIVDANHSIMGAAVELLTGKTYAQSEPDFISAVAGNATNRGIAANGLTQRNA